MNEKIGAVTDKHNRRTFTLDEINEKNREIVRRKRRIYLR